MAIKVIGIVATEDDAADMCSEGIDQGLWLDFGQTEDGKYAVLEFTGDDMVAAKVEEDLFFSQFSLDEE